MDLAADLPTIIEGEFSQTMIVSWDGGTGGRLSISVKGLFDRSFQQVYLDTGATTASRMSQASFVEETIREKLTDAGFVGEPFKPQNLNWYVKAGSEFFVVNNPELDGKGIITLMLTKASDPND